MNKLVLLAAALALAGCKKKVDTAKYEERLTKDLGDLGIKPDKVKCPSDVQAKKGASFQCTVTIAGKDYGFEATIDEVDGEDLKMSTHWTDGRGVVGGKIEGPLGDELTKTLGTPTEVDCGDPLRFVDKDMTLGCKATAGATSFDVKITFDDALNATGWTLTPEPVLTGKLVEWLTGAVSTKVGVPVTVKCGDASFLLVPSDNIVMCDVTDSQKTAKLKVTFKAGTVDPESWEVVAN